MDEVQFNAAAEETLSAIERALDACDEGLDYEVKPGGVLELEFDDGSKIIINRHTAAREIWVAARSGGFHFKPDSGRWIGTRDGAELFEMLSGLISRHAGTEIRLTP
jgi:iron-sulfur cluster assembly protein CyaY